MQKTQKQDKPDTTPATQTKTRRCLSCGNSFPSEWAGERVCKKCKSTTTWRTG